MAYEGKIKNSGNQTVKAPYSAGSVKSGKVIKGKDLRSK